MRAARTAIKLRNLRAEGLSPEMELRQFVQIRHVFLAAMRTNTAYQTLRDDPAQCGRNDIGIDTDIDQTVNCTDRVICMDRGKHEVTRDRGSHRNLCRLAVTDLTDSDDVRVLTQDRAQAVCKRHADFFIDLYLIDTFKIVLDRVFQGDKVDFALVQLVDHRVHRRRLTTSGRSDDQDNAALRADHPPIFFQILTLQADLLDVDLSAVLIQQTGNHLFPVDRGERRKTDVDVFVLDVYVETAIQRDVVLCDIHARHDLDPGNDCCLQVLRHCQDITHKAVHTKPHLHLCLLWLEVDITGTFHDPTLNDGIDQSDRRCGIRSVLAELVRDKCGGVLFFSGKPRLVLHLLDRFRRALIGVQHLDRMIDRTRCGNDRHHALFDGFLHFL